MGVAPPSTQAHRMSLYKITEDLLGGPSRHLLVSLSSFPSPFFECLLRVCYVSVLSGPHCIQRTYLCKYTFSRILHCTIHRPANHPVCNLATQMLCFTALSIALLLFLLSILSFMSCVFLPPFFLGHIFARLHSSYIERQQVKSVV